MIAPVVAPRRVVSALLPALVGALLVWGGVFDVDVAHAHGGDDHGANTASTASGAEQTGPSVAAESGLVSLVLRMRALAAPADVPVHVLIAQADDNAPLEGAAVNVLFSDASGRALPLLTLAATRSPGLYEGTLAVAHDGDYAAAITVVRGDLVDTVTVSGLTLGASTAVGTSSPTTSAPGAGRGVAVIVGFALLLVGVVIGRLSLRRSGAVVVIVATVGAGTVRAHGGEDHGAPAAAGFASGDTVAVSLESQFLLGIRTARVVNATLVDTLAVPGVVTTPPEHTATIFVPQAGRVLIDDLSRLRLGAPVKRGAVLAVVEATLAPGERASFSVEAAQADAEIAAARARLTAAQANLARVSGLAGVIADRERDDAAVAVADAESAVTLALAKRAAYSVGTPSARTALTAPIDGIVADVGVAPGEVAEAGRRAFVIVNPNELWVEARVYEGDVGRLSRVRGALVSVDAWPGDTFAATLLAVAAVVDPDTRTVKAVFRVDDPTRKLRVGMFSRVALRTSDAGAASATAAPQLVIPQAAVLDIEGKSVVFVHTAPERYQRREVRLGRRDGERVEVLGGLRAGERVATASLLTLKNAPPAPQPRAKAHTPAAPSNNDHDHDHDDDHDHNEHDAHAGGTP